MAAVRKLDESLSYEIAEVTAVSPGALRVRAAGGDYAARRAASCLLEPGVGDQVALLTSPRGACWVIAVLERAEPEAVASLSVDGDLALRGATVSIAGAQGVSVTGPTVRVATGALEIAAAQGRAVLDALSLLAGAADAEIGRARVTASTLDVVAERVHTRAKRVMRFVEEIEQLRAGGIDAVARNLLNLRGKTTVVTAEEVAKIDGAQVLIG
ncbi:MAG: DUF3540 domain-containing protein [Polyangiales bacterium]